MSTSTEVKLELMLDEMRSINSKFDLILKILECPDCYGSGKYGGVEFQHTTGGPFIPTGTPCMACNGKGYRR